MNSMKINQNIFDTHNISGYIVDNNNNNNENNNIILSSNFENEEINNNNMNYNQYNNEMSNRPMKIKKEIDNLDKEIFELQSKLKQMLHK